MAPSGRIGTADLDRRGWLSRGPRPGHATFEWPTPAVITAVLLLAPAVVVLRRPDAITTPQFYAEDGTYWFADAYNRGLGALLLSNAGYLQTLPRLVAVPAGHLGLVQGALLFNTVAIAVQVAPAGLLVSRRFSGFAPLRVRVALALAYVLLPNIELDANITNAQWHLAVLAVMILVARAPRHSGWRVADLTVLLLCGLTGPFSLLLVPAAAVLWWRAAGERRWYACAGLVLLSTLALQAVVFVQSHRGTGAALGASLANLVSIVSDRVVLAGSFGQEGHGRFHAQGRAFGTVIATLVMLAAALIVVLALRRASLQVRVFLLVCFGITAASLVSPLVPPGNLPAWSLFAVSDGAERYFFSAELAWLVCVVIAVSAIPRAASRDLVAALMVLCFLSGPVLAWRYPAYADRHLADYDARLRSSPPGTVLAVPINPDWTMTLTRQ